MTIQHDPLVCGLPGCHGEPPPCPGCAAESQTVSLSPWEAARERRRRLSLAHRRLLRDAVPYPAQHPEPLSAEELDRFTRTLLSPDHRPLLLDLLQPLVQELQAGQEAEDRTAALVIRAMARRPDAAGALGQILRGASPQGGTI